MTAMDKQHLDIPVYNPSYLEKLCTILTFFKVFPLLLNSGELERLNLNHIGKAHKHKHISKLHASQYISQQISYNLPNYTVSRHRKQ